jgi:nitrate reductase gamma subunit
VGAPEQSVPWLVVKVAVGVVLGAGLMGNLAFWLRAADRTGEGFSRASIGRGAIALLRPATLGHLLLEVLFQWRLRRVSTWRWLAHGLLFWGNVILFFVGSLGLMLAEKGMLPITKDTPWFALTNEVAGVMVFLGVALSVYRYCRVEEQRYVTSREGLVWLVLLGMVALSGYALEGARLAAAQVPPPLGWYSFVGYGLAQAVPPRLVDWVSIYPVLWWFHAGSAMALVAAIPYGRLFHLVASPLAIAVNLASLGAPSPRKSRAESREGERVYAGEAR